jgi:hypothetical protein
MKKHINEDGFHLIMIPLLIVVVAIIGFAGWYVWNRNHKSTNNQVSTSSIQQAASTVTTELPSISSNLPSATPTQSTQTSAEDLTANWETYTNSQFGYTIKYPNDWMSISDGCFENKESAQSKPIINMPGVKPGRDTTGADLCIFEPTNYSSYLMGITKQITINIALDLTGIDIQDFASTYYCWLDKYPQAPVNMGNEVINSQTGKIYVSSCRLDGNDYTTYYSRGFYVSNEDTLYMFNLKDNPTSEEKNIYRIVLSTFNLNN